MQKIAVPTCHVLLVAPNGPGRAALARILFAHGFETTAVPANEAAAIVREERTVAIALIDEDIGRDRGVRLVDEIRESEPDLPIVWATRSHSATREVFQDAAPDQLLVMPLEPDELNIRMRSLVNTEAYIPAVVGVLCDAVTYTLTCAFRTDAEIIQTFMKANRCDLSIVNALLPFSGPRISGWILTSANEAALESIGTNLLQQAGSAADLHDLAGEVANHVTGHLKASLAAQGFHFTKSSPIFIHGEDCHIRSVRGQHSVVAEAGWDGDKRLYTRLHLEAHEPIVFEKAPPEIPYGEVRFFDAQDSE